MQNFGHDHPFRDVVPGVDLIVALYDLSDCFVRFFDSGISDLYDASASYLSVLRSGGVNEYTVFKPVEPERISPKSRPGRKQVQPCVTVTRHRKYPPDLDYYLMPLKRWDAFVEPFDGGLELFARHRVKEVCV